MTLELGLAGIVCLVGLVIYLAATNPKVAEVGRIMFAFGLLVGLLGVHELGHLLR